VPGRAFDPDPNAPHAALFFFLYFAMTGLHAVHLTIGVGIVAFVLVRAYRGAYSSVYHTPVEVVGLYWHFVDIVWIFLFPLLYLVDRHG
jgi:cytochrome c oxidase subunit 3